jgi:LemA protein
MEMALYLLAGIVGIGLLGFLFFISLYNKIVRLKNVFKNAFAQIDVQLNRRYDLIPNLVETAKGYMEHEKETLTGVIEARNKAHEINVTLGQDALDTKGIGQLLQAEKKLTSGLGGFYAVMENYPDLKSNTTMINLMEELSSTENKISFARQAYNDAVMGYNTALEVFPSNLIAALFNFKEATLFEIPEVSMKSAPKVKF